MQQAELGVGQLQVVFDRLDHQGEDLPVNKREDVRHHADAHDIPLVGIALFLYFGRGLAGHSVRPLKGS
ncbi:hypothetical protein D9M71_598480 [compost metagenome]